MSVDLKATFERHYLTLHSGDPGQAIEFPKPDEGTYLRWVVNGIAYRLDHRLTIIGDRRDEYIIPYKDCFLSMLHENGYSARVIVNGEAIEVYTFDKFHDNMFDDLIAFLEKPLVKNARKN